MKKIALFFIAVLASAVSIMAATNEKGGPEKITKEIDLDGFTGLKTGNMLNVEVRKGDFFDIRVEISKDIADILSFKVKDNKLVMDVKNKITNFRILTSRDIFVYVTMPELKSLYVGKASTVSVSGEFSTAEDFLLEVSGASTIAGLDIQARKVDVEVKGASTVSLKAKGESLDIDMEGASSLALEGYFNSMKATVKGASKATLSGSVGNSVVDITGVSTVDAVDMKIKTCKSKVSRISTFKQF